LKRIIAKRLNLAPKKHFFNHFEKGANFLRRRRLKKEAKKILHIFGYIIESNREIWRYFQKVEKSRNFEF
jgi:hypothetical protein